MSKFTKCRADLKIVVVGNSGTGKTSFCKRWINDEFDNTYKATVLSDFSYKVYEFEGNYYKIQFWDIAGQDKNIYTSKVFTKNAHGCILLSDLTNPDTLKVTIKWKNSIDENSRFIDGDYLPSLLVQNKVDLITDENLKEPSEEEKFVNDNKFNGFFRTSCLNGNGIHEVIDFIIKNIIERLEAHSKSTNTPFDNTNRTSIVVQNQVNKNYSLLTSRNCCNY